MQNHGKNPSYIVAIFDCGCHRERSSGGFFIRCEYYEERGDTVEKLRQHSPAYQCQPKSANYLGVFVTAPITLEGGGLIPLDYKDFIDRWKKEESRDKSGPTNCEGIDDPVGPRLNIKDLNLAESFEEKMKRLERTGLELDFSEDDVVEMIHQAREDDSDLYEGLRQSLRES